MWRVESRSGDTSRPKWVPPRAPKVPLRKTALRLRMGRVHRWGSTRVQVGLANILAKSMVGVQARQRQTGKVHERAIASSRVGTAISLEAQPIHAPVDANFAVLAHG